MSVFHLDQYLDFASVGFLVVFAATLHGTRIVRCDSGYATLTTYIRSSVTTTQSRSTVGLGTGRTQGLRPVRA
jgi:hypothetical protein